MPPVISDFGSYRSVFQGFGVFLSPRRQYKCEFSSLALKVLSLLLLLPPTTRGFAIPPSLLQVKMLFAVKDHPLYRAQLLLARAAGGLESLPSGIQRMDKVAEIFSTHIRPPSQTEASAASAAPASTRSQDVPQPRAMFQAPSAACRDFDPFITSDLGEWMGRIKHVLSIALGNPDCTDEDRKEIADIWRDEICNEVKYIVGFIRQNKESLVAAWEAGKPYLGPDTKAGRERMRNEHQAKMISGLAENTPRETVNSPRESRTSAFPASSIAAASPRALLLTTLDDAEAKSYAALANLRNQRGALEEQNMRLYFANIHKHMYDFSLPLDRDFPRSSNITSTDEYCTREHWRTSAPATVASEGLQHMRLPRFKQHSTAPESGSLGHKEEFVEATRTALGSLSLSEQNRRNNNTPAPERVGQQQCKDEGYDALGMGYSSPKDDEDNGHDNGNDNDNDSDHDHDHNDYDYYEQGQAQPQDQHPFEQQQQPQQQQQQQQ